MTDTRLMSTDPAEHKRSRTLRRLFGLALGITIAGVSVSAIAAPMLNPGPLAPIARVLPYKIDQCARLAMVKALLDQGYTITPVMQIAGNFDVR